MAKISVKGTIVADDDKWIYDWYGIATTCPGDVHAAIQEASGENLEVEINSGGGDVIAGNEIYTALRMYRGKVDIIISGMAASAASYIATARRCEMSPVGIFMIHNASGGARGDYHAMDKESEVLQTVNRAIAAAYMDKTKLPLDELLGLMDRESWLTAEKALEYGFVDAIIENQEEAQQTGLFDGGKAAIYNAATVLDRKTIERTKEMLTKASAKSENAAPGSGMPLQPESVLDSNNKAEEAEDMEDEIKGNIQTVDELSVKYPSLAQKIRDDAYKEATAAENGRLRAIDEISGQISAELVHEAKYGEKRMTAESLALEAFRRNGIMAKEALADLKDDISRSGAERVGADANSGLAESSMELDHDTKVQNLAKKFERR